MSLFKKPRMTKKKLAALAEARRHSHGPATSEGRERIRTDDLDRLMGPSTGGMAVRIECDPVV
jgi:hypothetical protein